MGCGAGPPEVPAEPNEPCQTGYIRLGGNNEEMETCVCENKGAKKDMKAEDKKKEPYAYCNYQLELVALGTSLGSSILLTTLAASVIILITVQM